MRYEDEIYHSGYLDGYYAGMELYHSDEMTDEEKEKARRRKRKIALGVGIPVAAAAGLLGGTYLYNEAKYNKELKKDVKAWRAARNNANANGAESFKAEHKPKRNIPGFKRNPGSYRFDPNKDFGGFLTLQEMHRKARDHKLSNRKGFTKSKPKRNIPGFRRNPGTYTINPVTGDFGSYLTLHGMHIRARQGNKKT